MTKTLYFEGAGCSGTQRNDVENCRIRTAFTNNKGKQIYLEMGAGSIYNKKDVATYHLYIDHVFYITGDRDDCNKSQIRYDYHEVRSNYNYTKEHITEWINRNLNCSFETIEALPDLSGYRVHGDKGTYNFMENYNYNPELIQKREEIQKYFYELEKAEKKQYPNFSLWVDEKDINLLHLLRHFNGYNKHWSIRTDSENWKDTIEETKLGRYAC